MKKFSIKVMSVFLSLCALFYLAAVQTGAISYSNNVQIHSKSILLVSLDSGQVVFEKEADARRYPASTTKIMTYIIAREHIQDIDNTRIEIKKSVLDPLKDTGSSLANVEQHVGGTMSAKDLLYSMMVPSGNDAAMVLADYIGGGDINNFVSMMNNKAAELGCNDTHFDNPDGLHSENHYTTARDLYLITKCALEDPLFKTISNTTKYTCEGESTPLLTTNLLIDSENGGQYYYTYAEGIKTGTTDQAGRCLVTTASADGYSYIAIILGAPYQEGVQEEYYTFTDAAELFRWCLTSLEMQTIKSTSTPVCECDLKLAWGKNKITIVPEKNLNAIVPKDIKNEEIQMDIDVPEVLEAPMKTDTPVGSAVVYYVDSKTGERQEISKVSLVPIENVDRSGILAVIDVAGKIFKSYWFIIVILIIVVVLLIYTTVAKISRKRRRKNKRVKNYRNL